MKLKLQANYDVRYISISFKLVDELTFLINNYSMYFIKITYILSNILARKFSHINSRQFHHSSHTKQTQINKHAKHATIKCEL